MLKLLFFFFFKQKTAYELRISDWSSDVCSSDLIRDRKHGWHLVTFHQVGCRLALGRRGFGGPPKRLRRFDGEHSQKPRPANVKRALLDDCAYAATWHGLEVLRHRNVDAMFLCAGHQCLRDRMFGIALDGCGHAKHLVIGESIGGSGLYDAMRTESERTCLVEHHRVQETSFFEAEIGSATSELQ